MQALWVQAQRLHDGRHARHVSLVVDGPDVDYAIETSTYEFVIVIGNVAGEIGRGAVGADDDLVLVVFGVVAGQNQIAPSRSTRSPCARNLSSTWSTSPSS